MKPYFISDLQRSIEELPEEKKQEIRLLLQVNEKEEYRKLCFAFPCEELLLKKQELYRKYLLAMINNMLVSFGGAKLTIYRREGSAALDRLLTEAIAEFQQDSLRNDRTGYGVYLNYINRMNVFLGSGPVPDWRFETSRNGRGLIRGRSTAFMCRRMRGRNRSFCAGRQRSLREPVSVPWMWVAIPSRGLLFGMGKSLC